MKMRVQLSAHVSLPVGQKVEAYTEKTKFNSSQVIDMALRKFFGMAPAGQDKPKKKLF